jgi:ectoine hydroxylase-related dioxygenase (phytanoyl-CoA dioxygenase family)
MRSKVLNSSEIEQFMELGYVKLEEAYSRSHALRAQDYLWDRLAERGFHKSDPATWTEPMVRMNETYNDDVFQVCNTSRLADAIEDLIGEGRYADRIVYGEDSRRTNWGWWPVNFSSGAEEQWSVPTTGWHWDGIQFRHFIDSPDQGLLCLCLFSDISTKGGGTLVAEGSHKPVSRYLQDQPEGVMIGEGIRAVNTSHPWFAELTGSSSAEAASSELHRKEKLMEQYYTDASGFRLKVAETTGLAGDVFLCHPFLYHAASQNHSGIPRFMCNRTTPLKERMNFNRASESEYSPLELSIKRALG